MSFFRAPPPAAAPRTLEPSPPVSPIDLTASNDPTRTMMRQIAGSFAEYEKARLVGKLRAARDRIRKERGRCEGRQPLWQTYPEAVLMAKRLHRARGVLNNCADLPTLIANSVPRPQPSIRPTARVYTSAASMRRIKRHRVCARNGQVAGVTFDCNLNCAEDPVHPEFQLDRAAEFIGDVIADHAGAIPWSGRCSDSRTATFMPFEPQSCRHTPVRWPVPTHRHLALWCRERPVLGGIRGELMQHYGYGLRHCRREPDVRAFNHGIASGGVWRQLAPHQISETDFLPAVPT